MFFPIFSKTVEDPIYNSSLHLLYDSEMFKDKNLLNMFITDSLNRVKISPLKSYPDFNNKDVPLFVEIVQNLSPSFDFLSSPDNPFEGLGNRLDKYGLTRFEWAVLKFPKEIILRGNIRHSPLSSY